MRTRAQASALSEFEAFDVNTLRDLVDKAHGRPADEVQWGRRVGGGDSVSLQLDVLFDELGHLCRRVETTYGRTDYRDRFGWLDQITPVTDPVLREQLAALTCDRLRAGDLDGLQMAPPEVLDLERVSDFRYHFDHRPRMGRNSAVSRPDLDLGHYMRGLGGDVRATIDEPFLRNHKVFGLNGDGADERQWTVWRCLLGEVELAGSTYVLDEGDFYAVHSDYVDELNAAIEAIPTSDIALPASTPTTREDAYIAQAVASSPDFILMDQKNVHLPGHSAIEVCDLATTQRQLVHIKRHLHSKMLSHQFAQGLVAADLLQRNAEFRRLAHEKMTTQAGGVDGFGYLGDDPFVSRNFEIVFAISARWEGRSLVQALPFFSKVNLREVVTNLSTRGYKVTSFQIEA